MKVRSVFYGLALLQTTLNSGGAVAYEVGPGKRVTIDPKGNYAVVISSTTFDKPEWHKVAEYLCHKHAGCMYIYNDKVEEVLPELRTQMPAYICFVGVPEECSREFVVQVSRMTRQLDTTHPYGDALWGIITGYTAEDAQRIASRSEPLVIRQVATSMGPGNLERFDGGFASNEDVITDFWFKRSGDKEVTHKRVEPDAAEALAGAFNTIPVDVFYTSGHATEHDWQIAYNLPGGHIKHEEGKLYAESDKKSRYPFATSSPKVYLAVGNCLIGRIDKRDCMATSWLHSGGVHQMVGYTAVTFYGYMGWGTGMLFTDGRLTLAEAFYLNNQALMHRLQGEFSTVAGYEPKSYESRDIGRLKGELEKLGCGKALGLIWDRDVVVFYGDPGWSASYPCTSPDFSYRVKESGGVWRVSITVERDGGTSDPKWGVRPFMALWPERLSDVKDIKCESDRSIVPVVTPRFMLLPLSGKERIGEQLEVSFSANKKPRQLVRGSDGALRHR